MKAHRKRCQHTYKLGLENAKPAVDWSGQAAFVEEDQVYSYDEEEKTISSIRGCSSIVSVSIRAVLVRDDFETTDCKSTGLGP